MILLNLSLQLNNLCRKIGFYCRASFECKLEFVFMVYNSSTNNDVIVVLKNTFNASSTYIISDWSSCKNEQVHWIFLMLCVILTQKNPSTDHAAQSANEKRHQNPFDNQQNKGKHERWISTIPVCIFLIRLISPMTIPSCNRLKIVEFSFSILLPLILGFGTYSIISLTKNNNRTA